MGCTKYKVQFVKVDCSFKGSWANKQISLKNQSQEINIQESIHKGLIDNQSNKIKHSSCKQKRIYEVLEMNRDTYLDIMEINVKQPKLIKALEEIDLEERMQRWTKKSLVLRKKISSQSNFLIVMTERLTQSLTVKMSGKDSEYGTVW